MTNVSGASKAWFIYLAEAGNTHLQESKTLEGWALSAKRSQEAVL